jgi:EmrB/QacA subfamily drug resistance transporter
MSGEGASGPGDPAPTGRPARWLVEPARPEWVRSRPNAPYYALGAVCIGAFMGQLDASIVTVAFPTFERVFGASVGAVTWVGLSYLIVLVAGVTAVGRLADMVGRKLLYSYGFLIFIIGSGLCGAAPNLLSLDVFRVLQALGAVMLQANSVAIIYLAMPERRLVRGLGIQGAAQALGLAFGPSIGGFLLAAGGWRLIFLVNVPVGIVGMLAARVLVPRSRNLQARVPYDWVGLSLFVPAIGVLLVALSFGNRWGWVSPVTLGLLALALAGVAIFVVKERRAEHPMVDPSLFSRPAFSAGISSGLLSYLVLFGSMFAVPFFLERARGSGPGHAGLVLSALPLTLGAVAVLASRLAQHLGTRALTVSGMAITAAGLVALGVTTPTSGPLAAGLAVVGAGLGLFTPANNSAIMRSAPRPQAGVASGVLNMTRGLGTAMGLAVTGLVLGNQLRTPAEATAGFERAALLLASLAVVSGILATTRGHEGEPDSATVPLDAL